MGGGIVNSPHQFRLCLVRLETQFQLFFCPLSMGAKIEYINNWEVSVSILLFIFVLMYCIYFFLNMLRLSWAGLGV